MERPAIGLAASAEYSPQRSVAITEATGAALARSLASSSALDRIRAARIKAFQPSLLTPPGLRV